MFELRVNGTAPCRRNTRSSFFDFQTPKKRGGVPGAATPETDRAHTRPQRKRRPPCLEHAEFTPGAERDANLKILSLFSGLGGFDLGALGGFSFLGKRYVKTGNEIVFACDFNSEACAIYAENIGPIRKLDVRSVKNWKRTGRCGEADLVIGGPPCQPFSSCSQRRRFSDDERNMIPEFIRCIKQIRPKAFLMENVIGLIRYELAKKYFASVLDEMESLGYRVDWRILVASDFGVPQYRHRVFVQGRKIGGGGIAWPEPTHAEKPNGKLISWITVRDALADMTISVHTLPIRHLKEGGRRYPKYESFNQRLRADRPFPAILAEHTKQGGKAGSYHPWYDRAMTVSELKRGMGFPDSFIVPKPTLALGNAVPPVLAWHLIRAIGKSLEKRR